MEILKVYARGLIGIKRGIGLDEIEIDIAGNFSHGPIGICSDGNGAGKSTIMELLLQPYNTPLSRPGTMQAQFVAGGGEIHQTYLYKGDEYKFVRNFTKSKAEGFIFKNGTAIYKDGRIRGYDEMIKKLFGPFEIFKQITFVSQNGQRISEIASGRSQSAIKDLLIAALGLKFYKKYEDGAKDVIRSLEDRRYRSDVDYKNAIEGIEALKTEVAGIEVEQQRFNFVNDQVLDLEEADRDILQTIEENNATLNNIEREIAAVNVIKERATDLQSKLDGYIEKRKFYIDKKAGKLAGYESKRESLIALQGKGEEIEEAEAKIALYQSELSDMAIAKDNIGSLSKLKSDEKLITQELINKRREIVRISMNWSDKIASAERSAALICEVPCNDNPDMCESCKLLESARAERDKIQKYKRLFKEEIEVIDNTKIELSQKAEQAKTDMEKFIKDNFPVGIPDERNITSRVEAIKREIDVEQRIVDKKAEIARAEEGLASIDREIATMNERFEEAMADLDHNEAATGIEFDAIVVPAMPDRTELDAVAKQQNKKRELVQIDIAHAKTARDEILGHIQVLKEKRKQLEKRIETIGIAEGEKAKFDKATKDWNVIRRAMSRDGIPALEIEGAAGSIAAFANEILDVAGVNFRLRIDTQVTNKSGDVHEGFDIKILRGEEEPFDIGLLSGGEKVFPDIAIPNAIAVYRRMTSPWAEDIRTQFLDEPGGALTDDNRVNFFSVIEKMHQLSGKDMAHTFFVTHDLNVISQTAQRIELDMKNREYRIIN